MAQPDIKPPRPARLAPREWTFIAIVTVAWGVFTVVLGKETGWDFRNYHWYNAYAFLNGRLGFDVAVAHHATYYNPLIDVPFYLLAGATSWAALFFVGALQGLNIAPLYLMARSSLLRDPQYGGALLALICITGSTAISLTGATSYDTVLSVLVLSGLAILVARRERLSLGAVMAAGVLMGSAVGLKLVEAPFAVGFAAALLAIPGTAKTRALRLSAGALGGLAGVALFGGFWFATLWSQTGNPLFPYFNDWFGSPLALDASYRDTRFVPGNVWEALVYPFRFSFHYAIADDTPFGNLRVLAAYIAVPIAVLFWAFRRQARDPMIDPTAARILFAFAGASYVAWIAVFAVYRYVVALEMLAPLLIVAAIGFIPVSLRARVTAIALVLAATALMARYGFGPRADISDPYVQATRPPIASQERGMILMAGFEPMGFLVPSFPPQIPVLRIDGWLTSPHDGSAQTASMKARVAAHSGDLFLLAAPYEQKRAAQAASAYGLAIVETECGNITTNLGGPYRFCPLIRVAPHD